MKDALAKANVTEGFMNAVSPGTVAVFQPNEYYPSHGAYMEALADAMREEYETIVESGLLLQVDCPTWRWDATAGFAIFPTTNSCERGRSRSRR
jgi:methionine synthase II (cobalamin-independent)